MDANCGAGDHTLWLRLRPDRIRGIVSDALTIDFFNAAIASVFVARWCTAQRFDIVHGVYRVRDDEPTWRAEFNQRPGRHRSELGDCASDPIQAISLSRSATTD